MPEFLYVIPRKRDDDPFYVRALDGDELHPKVDGKRAAFVVCNTRGEDLGEWMSADQLRHLGRKISRAIPGPDVLVPV